jgi:hypothetical protein
VFVKTVCKNRLDVSFNYVLSAGIEITWLRATLSLLENSVGSVISRQVPLSLRLLSGEQSISNRRSRFGHQPFTVSSELHPETGGCAAVGFMASPGVKSICLPAEGVVSLQREPAARNLPN